MEFQTNEKIIPLDAVLVFGSGPVINKRTREAANQTPTAPGEEGINFWSETLAYAANELVKQGQTRQIIVLGGRTGGVELKSESELIAEAIQLGNIGQEKSSTNTLENLVNFLNLYLDNPNATPYNHLGILAQNFHLPRVKLLMQLFDIPYQAAFSSEEVMRFMARDQQPWDNQTLLEIEQRLDINTASRIPLSARDLATNPGYYGRKQGVERKTIYERALEEDVFSRALLEKPEYWIMYVGSLTNENRIKRILANMSQEMLNKRFGINLPEDIFAIKDKLCAISREVPKLDEWKQQPWPTRTTNKLTQMVNKR